MITIYGLKSCDTCRKAAKALQGTVFRDIREDPMRDSEIAELLNVFGQKLINRSSTTWRNLDVAAQQLPAAVLLARHPTVMKRPVIRSNDALYLGWTDSTRAALGVG